MNNIFKISYRNLMRNHRRSLLTASLITLGVVFVLVYSALSGSFKSYMIGQITDSMIGHIQIHKQGYVASVDMLPLDKNIDEKTFLQIESKLKENPYIESYTVRLKLGAMFSNFTDTTNIRLNAVYPKDEFKSLPLLKSRVMEMKDDFKQGEILVPDLLSKGMGVKVGDTIVLVANNKSGSVNGTNLKIAGIVGQMTGPGGRDGYMHIEDANRLLRAKGVEISEIAIRLNSVSKLKEATASLKPLLEIKNKNDKPLLEIHTWEQLSPFFSIVKMLDVMSVSIKIILISIVLISILNVMIMSVYERVREIGTIAAMGTPPGTIVKLFLMEGLLLGSFGTLLGIIVSLGITYLLGALKITYSFGKESGLLLTPSLGLGEIVAVAVIVIAVSLVASLFPALKASRLEPVEALRTY